MRILSITPTFHPNIGGLEAVVREIAVRTCRSGQATMDVAHVATEHPAFAQDTVDGVTVFRVPVLGNRLLGYARGLGTLARGYDLLHVHDPQLMMLSANVIAQCGRIPAVLSTHGGFRHTRRFAFVKSMHEKLAMRRVLSHYRQVLAVSQSDYDYFRDRTEHIDKCEIGIDWSTFQQGVSPQVPAPTRWIYWGRWSTNKRIDAVIDAVAQARELGIAVDLLICGSDFDGLGPALAAQIQALKLEPQVTLQPYADHATLMQALRERAVFVTGTEYEGFGLGIIEAMAAGKVVVCRDMEPINGFVDARNGFYLRFDRSEADAATLRTIAALTPEAWSALSAAAQARARTYDWSAMIDRILAHYQRAVER